VLNRKQIADGVFLSKITDARFKQNRISVNFLTQLSEETASVNAVIPGILTNSNRVYPDLRELNARLAELYGANLSGASSAMGDTQCIEISIKTLDTRFALEGEDITGEGVKILLDCIFEPLTENGGFSASVVENEKQSCIDDIEAELNDKRMYAVRQATRLLCDGEPAATSPQGTLEGVETVTPQSAFSAYRKLLETARTEILCVGCNDFGSAETLLTNAFAKVIRGETQDCYSSVSKLKDTVVEFTEKMEVNQSKMVLGLKYSSDDRDATALMTKIYGGSPTSKLFENVREKLSLCYYCFARNLHAKRLIIAECGVESDNLIRTKDEILAQLDAMKTGEFGEKEITQALLSYENDLKVVGDSLSGLRTWYLTHIYLCDVITPEEAVARYTEVAKDKERLVNAAKSVQLDTVYVLDSEVVS
jgi:predicted Zn-dependent peptidase